MCTASFPDFRYGSILIRITRAEAFSVEVGLLGRQLSRISPASKQGQEPETGQGKFRSKEKTESTLALSIRSNEIQSVKLTFCSANYMKQ